MLLDGRSRVRDGIVLVAAAGGAIAGTVTLALPGSPLAHLCRADEAEVRMLAVDEAARGLGIADRLMAACETLARYALPFEQIKKDKERGKQLFQALLRQFLKDDSNLKTIIPEQQNYRKTF